MLVDVSRKRNKARDYIRFLKKINLGKINAN